MAALKKLVPATLMTVMTIAVLALPVPSHASETSGARKKATSASKAIAANARAYKRIASGRVPVAVHVVPAQLSYGQVFGLHDTADALALKSSVALVLDQDTNEVLFSKNSQAVLPIASLTKLMTALVVTEAKLPLDEALTVTQEDVDTEKRSGSRLKVGTQLTRLEMMHLALMSSENRAAHALGRHYPGGLEAFVKAMNLKAQSLGGSPDGVTQLTITSSGLVRLGPSTRLSRPRRRPHHGQFVSGNGDDALFEALFL